ncbi:MAG: nodulation protein NfeD, partial [Peptococcia bacterium]
MQRARGARTHKRRVRFVSTMILSILLIMYSLSLLAAPQTVYVIRVQDTIDQGLVKYIERSYQEAEKAGASMVILEIDTNGGLIDSAIEIRDIVWDSSVPTVALVSGRAISAGAFVTVACPQIAMVPGSTIGDAEARINGERADEKYLSAWRQEFAATAERNGRDPDIARAMVDRDLVLPGISEEGKLLTLTYT